MTLRTTGTTNMNMLEKAVLSFMVLLILAMVPLAVYELADAWAMMLGLKP